MSTLITIFSLLAVTVAVSAYPTKDDDSFYYGRLHDLSNFNKESRNLDGIDGRSAVAALPLMAKADQDLGADKGSQPKYRFGAFSGSHLDGIGGGHLVRDLESDFEQGLGSHSVVVKPPMKYGRLVLYPRKGPPLEDKFDYLMKSSFADDVESVFGGDYDFAADNCENTSQESTLVEEVEEDLTKKDIFDLKRKRQMDSIGGGHLLRKKYLGGGEKMIKDHLNVYFDTETPKYLDFMGVGHLLAAKREMATLGGGHLLKRLDTLDGGNILSSKREMDPLGGGHLLKRLKPWDAGNLMAAKKQIDSFDRGHITGPKMEMDALGGGHLRKRLDALGGSHFLKRLDTLGGGHLLAAKRQMDSLGGGHLLKRLDALGGGHLLAAKRQMDSLGGGHLLAAKREMDALGGGDLLKRLDALGGGHLLAAKRQMDSLGGGHLLVAKREMEALGGDHLLQRLYALGGGNPLVAKRETDALGGGNLLRDLDLLRNRAELLSRASRDQGENDKKQGMAYHYMDPLMGNTIGLAKRFHPFDSLRYGSGPNKREWDEIDRSSFGSFAKKNFDEIDRSGFGGFVKKNFDEIDRSGFGSFVKRSVTQSAPEVPQN